MHETYQFGVLLVLFGGFLALNSTGLFADIGMGALFLGAFVGTLGVLQSGLDEESSP